MPKLLTHANCEVIDVYYEPLLVVIYYVEVENEYNVYCSFDVGERETLHLPWPEGTP